MTYKKKFIIILCFTVLVSNLQAKTVSLAELIDIAVLHNSNIKISQYTQEKQKFLHNLSKTDYLPKISLSGEFAQYDIDTKVSNQNDQVNGYTITASQLLYDFGRTSNKIELAKKNIEASNFQTVQNIASTVLQTKKAYYSILNNFQQINLAEESIKIDTLHLEQANSYFNAGVKTRIDVTDAKLQLSNSKLKLLQSQYSLQNAKTKLISIVGKQKSNELEIQKDNEIQITAQNLTKENLILSQLMNQGLENRAELKAFEKQIQAQQLALQNFHNEYYPTLNLDASYNDKSSDEITSIDAKQAIAGIYIKWNLYTGDSTNHNIKIALSDLSSLKQQYIQQKLQIQEDITNAFLKVKENQESINFSLLNVNLSADKLDLANQRYKAGLNDLVEVNDSKLAYTQSKSELINTYYNYLISKATLEYAIGVIY